MKTDANKCYCDRCKKDVPWHSQPVNHRKQLLLSLCTLGMWLPMWFFLAVVKTKFCDACESPIVEE